MKLIIDIPEEDYNNIEPFLNGETIKGGFNLFKTLEIIKNGTPLDNLTADLEALREPTEPHLVDYRYHRNDMLDAVLSVIDKYKGVSK